MAQQPHDDLFEGPAMTFGEHLEELRVCLVKSLLGMMLGVAIGMFLANAVVRFFQSPLERAMTAYYLKMALQDMEQNEFKSGVPAEISRFILLHGMVPDKVDVDLGQFSRSLADQYPGLFSHDTISSFGYSERDFLPDGVPTLVKRLAKEGAGSGKSVGKRVWELLSEDDRKTFTELSQAKDWAKADSHRAIAVLNRLIDQPELYRSVELRQEVPTATEDKPTTEAEKAGKKKAVTTIDAEHPELSERDNIRRMNMRALHHSFMDALHPPLLNTTRLWLWKKVKIRFQTLNAQEAFMIWMKAGLVTGVALASPWIFYQIWTFVAAGLYRHEKGYVFMYLPMSIGLFLAGASLAFFFVFDPVLQFLFDFQQGMNAEFEPRIGEWMSFVLIMPLGFGVSFQLPLVMLFLNRIGLVETSVWTSNWRIAVLSIFVIAMVLTPADPVSMLLMAVPLCFLYVLGILMCHYMPGGRAPFAPAYEPS